MSLSANAAIFCLPVPFCLLGGEEERWLDDTGDSTQHEEDGDELCEAARLLEEHPRRQTKIAVPLEIAQTFGLIKQLLQLNPCISRHCGI